MSKIQNIYPTWIKIKLGYFIRFLIVLKFHIFLRDMEIERKYNVKIVFLKINRFLKIEDILKLWASRSDFFPFFMMNLDSLITLLVMLFLIHIFQRVATNTKLEWYTGYQWKDVIKCIQLTGKINMLPEGTQITNNS